MATDDRSARSLARLAALGAALAFAVLYRSTMLPGVDLGDTPSFQTMGGSPFISPRDAYPLYFALSAPVVWLVGDPAHGMNLASVVFASLACGVIVLAAFELAGSVAAALAAALAFGGSFTFWSQAIIAEVYALHVLCVAAVLLAALTWQGDQRWWRLALLLLAYAMAFGNHLTMLVLLPGLALFLWLSAAGGGRALLTPRVFALALGCALAGASQYLWNLRTLWIEPVAPASLAEALRWFWFDVTKQDWRDTMMLELPGVMAAERARMFVFDVRQQFAWWAIATALAGAWQLAHADRRRLWLLLAWYASTLAFALTYNVGDTHVFLLPAHLVLALLVAPGLAWLGGRLRQLTSWRHGRRAVALVGMAAVAAAGVRIHAEYPALDRSEDRRAEQLFRTLTADLQDRRSILLGDLDWQLGNGLNYYAVHVRDDLALTTVTETLPYAPTLIGDNLAIGREVVLTEPARELLTAAYGALFPMVRDPRVPDGSLSADAARLQPGQPYVLTWVKAARDVQLDREDLRRAIATLTGGTRSDVPPGDYAALVGLAGETPRFERGDDRPFTAGVRFGDIEVRVRMDAWMAFDTIRRMGFGQVIAGRHHALIIERGVSLVGLQATGSPVLTAYAAGLYAPAARYRLAGVP